jgi:omega-6 fatty acid desaturase (delta-12 desaturase)
MHSSATPSLSTSNLVARAPLPEAPSEAPVSAPASPQRTHDAALRESRHYTQAHDGVATWQLGSTLAALAGCVWAVHALGTSPLRFLLVLPISGLFVRLFVFQHDCGHNSFFSSHRVNDAVGLGISFITSMAYEAWRQAHAWHHKHQGKLSHRGIDNLNSPMTVREAQVRPQDTRRRLAFIRAWKIFALGIVSILLLRRHPKAYFIFWPNFRWSVRNRDKAWRGVHVTNAGFFLVQALFIWTLGWFNWATILLPAVALTAGIGTLLFWIQHNHEDTFHADDAHWSFASVGVQGSSYLKLGRVLTWFTGSIGLHHVHHLNPGIPNYRLEEARASIPALAAVAPLSAEQLRKSFTHVFWDEAQGRMVDLAAVHRATS